MASLEYQFVMIKPETVPRHGFHRAKLVIIALVLVHLSIILATGPHSDFRFLKTHPNGAKKKILFYERFVINCTTNDHTAVTRLLFQSVTKKQFQELQVPTEYWKRFGDVFILEEFGIPDAGMYQCVSTNRNGVTIKWKDPSTTIKPAREYFPKAKILPSFKSLDVGDNFNLTCEENESMLQLFKINLKNQYSTISRNKIITVLTGTPHTITMIIINATISDSGNYVCIATYEDKNDTKIATIEVKEPTPPLLIDYSGNMTSVVVRSPSKMSIYCTYQGYPSPVIKWYKNGKRVNSSCGYKGSPHCSNPRRIEESLDIKNDKLSEGYLTVFQTTYSDRGNYVCVASNRKGSASATIVVNIESGARILVNEEDQKITAELGQTVNMTCEAEGHPTPHVYWRRTDDHKVLEQGQGAVILKLSTVTKQDMGNYTCNATNFVSDYKLFTVSELLPDPQPIVQTGLKTEHLAIITVCICVVFLIVMAILWVLYRRQKMNANKYNLGSDGVEYQIDPDRSLLEQCRNLPYDSDWEFPEERLIFGEILGSGAFGLVIKAEAIGILALQPRNKSPEAAHIRSKIWRTSIKKNRRSESITYTSQTVAVKTLKEGATKTDYTDLASELKILIHMGEHKNIINILGASTRGKKLMVITEYAPHGNLLTFLRERRDIYEPNWTKVSSNPGKELTLVDLGMIAYSISCGMEFLTSKKCVHRDLAARNILVGQDFVIKISDFGLARDIYHEDLYVKTSKGLLPIKWMALESLLDRINTHMSDVWSYGIVLWEIFTLGGTPYPTIPIEDLMDFLMQGQRMSRPNCCPVDVYELMRQCWNHCPEERPTFSELSQRLNQIFEDNVSEDTLGYLLLKKETAQGSECYAKLEPSLAVGGDSSVVEATRSKDETTAPSQASNTNEYTNGVKQKKMVEHKPLLNHESAV